MAKAKLSDVASRAGVSLATASLALSGKGRISGEVREQVQGAAESLGYTRKSSSGSLIRRGLKYIGILHHEDRSYEWGFIRPILVELELILYQRGYFPVVIPVREEPAAGQVLRLVKEAGVRAVFSIHYSDEELFTELEQGGIFVVLINNGSFQDKFYSVCVDDFQGAYEGALYLITLGHRDITYVEYERPENPAVLADRFVGFKKALDEHRLPFPPDHRITVSFLDEKALLRKLGAVISRENRPTAIFAHDDYLASHVLADLKELGLRVPEDVSLIAPGDVLDYAQPFVPQITTLRINTSLLGRIAANLMLDRIKSEPEDIHVLKVKQQLIKRATCRKLT